MSTKIESRRVMDEMVRQKLAQAEMWEAHWLKSNQPERAAIAARMKDVFVRKAQTERSAP